MLRLMVKREIPEDDALGAQWNALVEQMEQPQVFYTYEWALAVSRAYRNILSPLLCLAYDEEKLVGVAALAEEPGKAIGFLAGFTADYCDFVSHPSNRARLIAAVFDTLDRLRLPTLVVANFPAHSASSEAVGRAARVRGYRVFSRPGYECSQIAFRTLEQRQVVRQSVFSKQMARRSLRSMEKAGPVAVTHLKSWHSLAAELPGFARKHVARFLVTGRISNLARAERREFLTELARLLSQRGWVALSRLSVGERAIAWNYGFQFSGSWFWYQPTFDSEFQRYSPGFCLLSKIVEEACGSEDFGVVDLGLGAEGYKERLSNGVRPTLHITATQSSSVFCATAVRYHAAAMLKRAPRLERLARSAQAAVSSLRGKIGKGELWHSVSGRYRQRWGAQEVFFYEWPQRAHDRSGRGRDHALALVPVTSQVLAEVAMRYVDDAETLAYLLRSARRLASESMQGFALVDESGAPVHLGWIGSFEGFVMAELRRELQAPAPGAQLIFDCWTPAAVRRRGYYAAAIARVAEQYAWERSVWIFSARQNDASCRGIESAGFRRKFSLLRKPGLFSNPVVTVHAPAPEESMASTSAA